MSNTPPVEAQAPIEMHHFGSCICCQIRCSTGSIFITTRPATIIKSHCRGLKRKTSAPKRAMSCLLAPVAISSIPQQAVANGIGQRLFLRAPTRQRIEATDHHIVRHVYRHRNTPFRQAYAKPNPSSAMKTITSPNTSPRLSTSLPTTESMPTIC